MLLLFLLSPVILSFHNITFQAPLYLVYDVCNK